MVREPVATPRAVSATSPTDKTMPSTPVAPIDESAPEPAAIRTSEQLILHLYWTGRVGENGIASRAMTQGGMAPVLGISQGALTKTLSRLEAAGVLSVRTRHVEGQPRRLKVYELTPLGESLALNLRRRHPPKTRRP